VGGGDGVGSLKRKVIWYLMFVNWLDYILRSSYETSSQPNQHESITKFKDIKRDIKAFTGGIPI